MTRHYRVPGAAQAPEPRVWLALGALATGRAIHWAGADAAEPANIAGTREPPCTVGLSTPATVGHSSDHSASK